MQFEDIDYAELNTQSQLNDNFSQFMYDNSHPVSNFYQNVSDKHFEMPEETIENNYTSHYDANGFNHSGLLSSENHVEELDFVSYQNPHDQLFEQGLAQRMVMSKLVNKIEDYSNQMSSADYERYISTGDSSTVAATPCLDQFYNMNSPIETPVSIPTPNASITSAKSDQNAKRNMPVLFVQRVVKTLLDCMGSAYNGNSQGRLNYAYSILNRAVSHQDRPAFKEFLKSMDFGNKRTWSVISEKLEGKRADFRDALLDAIDLFLCEAGAIDFNIWVNENKKMKGETKAILLNSKEFFRDAFRSRYGGSNDLLSFNNF